MKVSKRKIRSDKFPLTLHPTGQYCKKIKGKMRGQMGSIGQTEVRRKELRDIKMKTAGIS